MYNTIDFHDKAVVCIYRNMILESANEQKIIDTVDVQNNESGN